MNYSKYFASDKFFVSFTVGNNNDEAINMEILAKENLIKKESCEPLNYKEISFIVDTEKKLNEFIMLWNLNKVKIITGKINLMQIFKEFSFKLKKSFKFEITSTNINKNQTLTDITSVSSSLLEEDGFNKLLIYFKITNNTDIQLKSLRLRIYLFQAYEDKILFNKEIDESILFYEGSLEHLIEEFSVNEEINFGITVYPGLNEHIFSSCLIIDDTNQVVYMCPSSISLYIE